jgi:isocitrate dehydrogenase (NAD+)
MTESIRLATLHFQVLLEEQLARAAAIEQRSERVDYASLRPLVIGVIGGDGIGPIIVKEARRLLDVLLKNELASGDIEIRDIVGLTLERRKALGQSIPEDILAAVKRCHVLLKGPTETPKGGTMESANVTLRRELDLYANVRPVRVPEEGIDWTFFRENTEGEYVLGSAGIAIPGKLAFDFKVTTDAGTARIARAALEYARANGRTQVAVVTKANIMKKTDGQFSRIVHETAADYPEIEVTDWYVDIMAANLINRDIRSRFQVFVMPNLYGDILTDEAAQIQGGVGTAGSANLGDGYAMFEAIHGSAPRLIADGLAAYCNPASLFRAVEMMLRHIGRTKAALRLAQALDVCLESERRLVVSGDRNGATCAEFSDYVLRTLSNEPG